MIEFSNIIKRYGKDKTALSNINFKIYDGEFVFIVGESGSGKTTLMKLILKEEEANFGQILLNDLDITHIHARHIPKIRSELGVIFQDFRLLYNRSVYDNIAYAMLIHGYPRKQIRKRVFEVLDMVKLSDKEYCFPDELSGGEQQRVSIARAIANKPGILLADEPTGNLDPDTAFEIMRVLKDINYEGTTIIMATHARDIVNHMKKRVIKLNKGFIIKDELNCGYY